MTQTPDLTPTDPVLTVQEAARYLRMSVSWLKQSDVPRVRMGRRVVFLRADLDTFLATRRTHGNAA